MPEPLEYPSKPTAPATPWSLAAVVGFALSIPGPALGFALARMVERILPDYQNLRLMIILTPALTGFALSLIAWVNASRKGVKICGERLAVAGIVISLMWGVLSAMLIFAFMLAMPH